MMKELLKKPHVYWVVGIFLLYMTANVILSQFWATARYIPYYFDTVRWGELLLSSALSALIGGLIAANSVLAYRGYRKRKKVGTEGAMTCAATVGGFATGICPACIASVFPLLLGIFGVSFSWAALPFGGIEAQLIIIAILGISLYFLERK